MGSRAVVLVCRDSARARFGIDGGGMVYTRTGRGFFERDLTEALLDRVRVAVGALWDELGTDWLLLDAELLPWSAKAGGLLHRAVRAGRGGRGGRPVRGGGRADAHGRAWRRRVRSAGRSAVARRQRRRVPRRLPPVLPAHRRAARRDAGAVRGAGRRGPVVRDAATLLAPGDRRPARDRRPRIVHADKTTRCRHHLRGIGRRRASTGGRSSRRPAARAWWSSRWPT